VPQLPRQEDDEGALNLVDHVLPDVAIRQWVLTMPFPLRLPLAFDGKLLGQWCVSSRTQVAGWYRQRHIERGLPTGESGALTVIQRANSDLRLNPAFSHRLPGRCLLADGDGRGQMFHPRPRHAREVDQVVQRHQQAHSPLPPRRGVTPW